jgi:hypothetical protein
MCARAHTRSLCARVCTRVTSHRSALAAVNRAQSRTIEKLTAQLHGASEIVVGARMLNGERATLEERLRVSACVRAR